MFRRSKDTRLSRESLLGSSTAASPERRPSSRFVIFLVITLLTLVSCLQLLSISVTWNSTGIGALFRKAQMPWAIVVISCNRPWYLEPVLKQLLSVPKQDLLTVSVYLSQDGYDEGVEKVAKKFQNNLTHWQRPRSNDDQTASTSNLAQHYKWTLDKLFFEEDFSHVIILEDDLLVSNDFLSYFKHTSEILEKDARVMCISAYNDIGRKDIATDPTRLFRTSFFPGLGWMLKQSFWQELSPMWPTDHFDWWLRSSAATRGRVCISPEVNRVRHIGHIGVNCNKELQGQADYDVDLSVSALPSDSFYEGKEPVEYTSIESLLRPAYDRRLSDLVTRAKVLSPNETDIIRLLIDDTIPIGATKASRLFLTVFHDRAEYESLSQVLFLSHVTEQRSFYRGIVEITLPHQGKLLLANARTCVFLPANLRSTPLLGIVPVVSEEGSSCDDACRFKSFKCAPERFDEVSDAYMMELFFPCERNAWVLDTSDTNPRYHRWPVNSDDSPLSSGVSEGTCFSNSAKSQCATRQPGAIRLCPCYRMQDAINATERTVIKNNN